MSIERAKAHLKNKGYLDRVIEPEAGTFTVEDAARALGCEPAHIAKTMSFYAPDNEKTILIVAAGDAKIDNRKFRDALGVKPHMLKMDEVEPASATHPAVCARSVSILVSRCIVMCRSSGLIMSIPLREMITRA